MQHRQPLALQVLQADAKHAPVDLVQDLLVDLDPEVRPDPDEVGVVRGVMDATQRQAVGDDRDAGLLGVEGDVRGVDQLRTPCMPDTLRRGDLGEGMSMAVSTIAGRRVELDASQVEAVAAELLPDPLRDHYVVVAGRRFPPKQLLAAVTGLDRADFTTHQARRALQRLGLVVGRVSTTQSSPTPEGLHTWPHAGREAQALAPFRGEWVAQRGLEVLVAADDPIRVVAWLQQHDVRGATVFRVPLGPVDTETALLR